MAVDDYNATAVTQVLASVYSVDASLITLEARPGSVQLAVTVASAPPEDSSSEGVTVSHILAAIGAASDETLGNALGSALGNAATTVIASEPRQATANRTIEFICPKGKWCTAGRDCRA